MFVKFHAGGGWRIMQADGDVRHIHPHGRVDIQDADADGAPKFDWYQHAADQQMPLPKSGEWADVITVFLTSPLADSDHAWPYRSCKWVAWVDHRGNDVLLVTDSVVYVCNDRGDTIEALR